MGVECPPKKLLILYRAGKNYVGKLCHIHLSTDTDSLCFTKKS